MRARRARILIALPALLTAALVWPAASQAFVGCAHSAGTLTVFVTQDDDGALIARGGDAINVIAGGDGGPEVLLACTGGTATVTNTDQIVVDEAAGAEFTQVVFDLNAGPLAPGLTPEADGTSEIEVQARMAGEFSFLGILGTSQDDLFHLGTESNGATGLNVNAGAEASPDSDFDISQVELLFLVAGRGNDVIRGRGSPGFAAPTGVFPFLLAGGGKGRDELIAGGPMAAFGGTGNDRMLGSRFGDLIDGGGGRDLIKSGRGNDEVQVARKGRDRVNCGGGRRDKAIVDEKDRLSNCERVRKPRRFKIPFPPGVIEFAAPATAGEASAAGLSPGQRRAVMRFFD